MQDNSNLTKHRNSIPKYKIILAVFVILFLVLTTVLSSFRVDKVIMEPGSAIETANSITINGVQTYDSQSEIRFLTVLVSANRPSLLAFLKAKYVDRDSEIFDWKEINGDLSPEVSSELNRALMLASQGAASAVALEYLGCEVPRTGTGAIIRAIEPGSPADDSQLDVGDTITRVNDKAIRLDVDVVEEIEKFKPGDEVEIEYEKSDTNSSKSSIFILTQHPDKEKGHGFLGVYPVTRELNFKYPVDIEFDSGSVSGPSAGLAFTIQIIDQLTRGDLAGSQNVAATGEIGLDGSVNLVGGVKQKAIAAKKIGADIMFVPLGEGDLARETAGDMPVHEVSTLEEALDILAKNGGDPLSQMQTCPSS